MNPGFSELVTAPKMLGMTCRLYFLAPSVLNHPLSRLVLGHKTLDQLRFAIGPQNIDLPASTGSFRAMKVGRCSDIVGVCGHGSPVQAVTPPQTNTTAAYLTSQISRLKAPSTSFAFRNPQPPQRLLGEVRPTIPVCTLLR